MDHQQTDKLQSIPTAQWVQSFSLRKMETRDKRRDVRIQVLNPLGCRPTLFPLRELRIPRIIIGPFVALPRWGNVKRLL
jgi:hypothetical protein